MNERGVSGNWRPFLLAAPARGRPFNPPTRRRQRARGACRRRTDKSWRKRRVDLPGGKTGGAVGPPGEVLNRSEEHTSELQSLMRISYAGFCLKKKNTRVN